VEGASDVKSFERSHVVCHCSKDESTATQRQLTLYDVPYLLRRDRRYQERQRED
jgi:hypothetical protein